MTHRLPVVPVLVVLAALWAGAPLASWSQAPGAAPPGQVTIHRDAWGVPHIYGPTDASVVFGAAYAQAEDNWPQVEDNFVRALGRGAERYGDGALLDDYLVRGLEIVQRSIREYERAPAPLRRLYDAYAAGFNQYLDQHPAAERSMIDRVEPWYTLALIRFKYHHNEFLGYAGLRPEHSRRSLSRARVDAPSQEERSGIGEARYPSRAWPRGVHAPNGARALGSNQWAVAGSRTASGYPMLLINPHVPFFGLSTYTEVHLHSDEGLVFSGLTRFGFMLPYMGNNAHLGWAYTDNYGDHGDLYLETLDEDGNTYRYGDGWRAVTAWTDTVHVRTEAGLEPRLYRYIKTHHGPVLGYTEAGQPLAVRLAKLEEGGWFEQWYGMMRATSLPQWRAAMQRLNVPYMNTMYADRDGNIQYIYSHAIPRRAPGYDWSRPVDGSDPGTEWQGYHALEELPQVLNPTSGYLQNTNSTPFTATDGLGDGPEDFPPYMVGNETDNRRAQRSRQVLRALDGLTLDGFGHAVLDTRLIAADEWLGDLVAAYEAWKAEHPARAAVLEGPIAALRDWDRTAVLSSVPATLFVRWAQLVNPDQGPAPARWLEGLVRVVNDLERTWGTWEVPWGEVNRIQRPDAAGRAPFDDALPSQPVAGAPGWLGSVFTFHARPAEAGRRHYGVHGNSFVKVIEFTPEVRARSIFVFGQSGDPASPHYFDQAALYSAKQFKPAWFSRDEVTARAAKTYTLPLSAVPGER
ncbi:MAG: penicillin acylase family protein [Rhodothermales bacterium]|nr:penicillin acylase family protein [Rhodothermales bacterium]